MPFISLQPNTRCALAQSEETPVYACTSFQVLGFDFPPRPSRHSTTPGLTNWYQTCLGCINIDLVIGWSPQLSVCASYVFQSPPRQVDRITLTFILFGWPESSGGSDLSTSDDHNFFVFPRFNRIKHRSNQHTFSNALFVEWFHQRKDGF